MLHKRKTITAACLALLLNMVSVKLEAQNPAKTQMPQAKQNQVVLKGKLKNFSDQVIIDDNSEIGQLLPGSSKVVIIPDSKGNFNVKLKLQSANYFRIGRNILYLSPDDDMEVFIDCNDPLAATFKGKGSEANTYLRNTPFPKAGSFLEAGDRVQNTVRATIDTILAIGDHRKKELDQVKNISVEFKRVEKARVKADLINSLLCGQGVYMPRRISPDSIPKYKSEFKAMASPLIHEYYDGFVDASLLKLVVYRELVNTLLTQQVPKEDLLQIREWKSADSLVEAMKKTGDKKILTKYAAVINQIKVPVYKNALKSYLAERLKFGNGDPVIDFSAVDLQGNKVNLSSLKGKVIYVDLWATWCMPCMAEMPHFNQLKEKYKENPNVVFVSLSIDNATKAWKGSVMRRKADGLQWLIDRNKLIDYNISGVPRTILINKNFIIENIHAPLPSDKELTGVIDRLLAK
jgi:thiol-disulfide isomerase/thioredoxin